MDALMMPMPPYEDRIESLVRAHLDRQAADIDAACVLTGIYKRLEDAGPDVLPMKPRGAGPSLRRSRWGVAVAAGVFLVVLSALSVTPSAASAEALVRQTQQEHQHPIARCYRMDLVPSERLIERLPLARPMESKVWTRGDRFRVDITGPGQPWTWGRDELSRVWAALTPQVGLLYEADEVPEALAEFFAVRSARLETLLGDVLRDFTLKDETDQESTADGIRRIVATPKPGRVNLGLHGAKLEIDVARHELRRLVLDRRFAGRPLGVVTLTLLERAPLPDHAFQLEGHLAAGATIYGKDRAVRRNQMLLQHFSHLLRRGPRT